MNHEDMDDETLSSWIGRGEAREKRCIRDEVARRFRAKNERIAELSTTEEIFKRAAKAYLAREWKP